MHLRHHAPGAAAAVIFNGADIGINQFAKYFSRCALCS